MDGAFSLEMRICARRQRKEQKLRRQKWFKLGYFLQGARQNMTHFSRCQWMQFNPLSSSWGNVGQSPALTCLVKDRVDQSSAQLPVHELHGLPQDVTHVFATRTASPVAGEGFPLHPSCRAGSCLVKHCTLLCDQSRGVELCVPQQTRINSSHGSAAQHHQLCTEQAANWSLFALPIISGVGTTDHHQVFSSVKCST